MTVREFVHIITKDMPPEKLVEAIVLFDTIDELYIYEALCEALQLNHPKHYFELFGVNYPGQEE